MNSVAKIVMVPTDIEIDEFIERVAAKFDVSRRMLKCSFRDEDGQMLDLSDQDEMEMLVELAKEEAKLNRREFGRAEVCTANCFFSIGKANLRFPVSHKLGYAIAVSWI